MSRFKGDKEKLEIIVIYMMVNFKYTPIELGQEWSIELCNKIDKKWKWALTTKRQIREAKLGWVVPDLGKYHMSIAMKEYTKKFV